MKADLLGDVIQSALTDYESIREVEIYGLWCIAHIEEFEDLLNKLGASMDAALEGEK